MRSTEEKRRSPSNCEKNGNLRVDSGLRVFPHPPTCARARARGKVLIAGRIIAKTHCVILRNDGRESEEAKRETGVPEPESPRGRTLPFSPPRSFMSIRRWSQTVSKLFQKPQIVTDTVSLPLCPITLPVEIWCDIFHMVDWENLYRLLFVSRFFRSEAEKLIYANIDTTSFGLGPDPLRRLFKTLTRCPRLALLVRALEIGIETWQSNHREATNHEKRVKQALGLMVNLKALTVVLDGAWRMHYPRPMRQFPIPIDAPFSLESLSIHIHDFSFNPEVALALSSWLQEDNFKTLERLGHNASELWIEILPELTLPLGKSSFPGLKLLVLSERAGDLISLLLPDRPVQALFWQVGESRILDGRYPNVTRSLSGL